MREHDVEALLSRFDLLQKDASFDAWRQLSQDVLSALVDQQGLVIALQRKALGSQCQRSEERALLRVRAEAAFALVQRLHQLRRRVHALIVEMRNAGYDARLAPIPYARAS